MKQCGIMGVVVSSWFGFPQCQWFRKTNRPSDYNPKTLDGAFWHFQRPCTEDRDVREQLEPRLMPTFVRCCFTVLFVFEHQRFRPRWLSRCSSYLPVQLVALMASPCSLLLPYLSLIVAAPKHYFRVMLLCGREIAENWELRIQMLTTKILHLVQM